VIKSCITCHDKKLPCMVNSVPVLQVSKWKQVEGSEKGDLRMDKRVQVEVEESDQRRVRVSPRMLRCS